MKSTASTLTAKHSVERNKPIPTIIWSSEQAKKPTFFGIPGADQHAFTLWSYDDAVRLKEHTLNMFRKAVLERDPQVRKEMLTFVVVGGGFTGLK